MTLQQNTKGNMFKQGNGSDHWWGRTRCIPCVVSWFSLCCRSRVSVTSCSAESRLQQRGWSSLGGLMASSLRSSDAELRWAGFLSIARFRKERIVRLQSSAMSSRGGACLWICQDRDNGSKLNKALTNPKMCSHLVSVSGYSCKQGQLKKREPWSSTLLLYNTVSRGSE